jgi:hypothetical protein
VGASIQWRQPPPGLRNSRYGRLVEFGRGRSFCRGYMASSSRVGPSVLVVDEPGGFEEHAVRFADALNHGGFTALSVDLAEVGRDGTATVLESACSFLSENWHPRLGVVAFDSMVPVAARAAIDARAEALVAYLAEPGTAWGAGGLPAMVHAWGEVDADGIAGADAELELYPYGDGRLEQERAQALDRTLDFLLYHLS